MESIKVKTTLDAKSIGWKGSQLRCLLLSSMEKSLLQSTLISIIDQKSGSDLKIKFTEDFEYYPKGLDAPQEVELDKANIPINGSITYCKKLNKWWLHRNARTPVWDFVCTAEINRIPGFILVEAKAHYNELLKEEDSSKAKKGSPNRIKIANALESVSTKYKYNLSADTHFQLSNRIAWSLKLASMGIPVVLIYLGCLNAKEMIMGKNDALLSTATQWEGLVTKYSKEVQFQDWEKIISGEKMEKDSNSVKSSFVYPIIRSVNVQIDSIEYQAKVLN